MLKKRRDLGNKLDANSPQLYYTFQERWTKRNKYDNFSVLQGRKPQKEQYAVVIPDYVKITYTCTIWTDYVAQMNRLIEMINYTSDSYWGDPERFKFNAKIDTYNNTTEVQQGESRNVKSNFGLVIQGYLIPDTLNKELNSGTMRKSFNRSIVSFGTEVVSTPSDTRKTREEVRSAPLAQNIEDAGGDGAAGDGVGFYKIGVTNKIG